MKVNKITRVLTRVVKELGDENLTISFSKSKGSYYVSISTHTSEVYQYSHGGYQRTCEITAADINKDTQTLVSDLVNTYKTLLLPKEDNTDVTE